MSEPSEEFEVSSDPKLSNVPMDKYRQPIPSTSFGNVGVGVPNLPPRPDINMQPSFNPYNSGYTYGGMPMTQYGMGGYGRMGYGNFGMGMGSYGMGMGAYGGYNGHGPVYGDIESRFIQIAEESSRPAFDSIQSLVSAVGSIAMMLESTFYALTSSFRAILGVAENFGRLRSLFAQFWTTFTVVRSLNWLIRKLLVLLGIRTESEFKAWAEAVAATQNGTGNPGQCARGSSWPILLFFGVIAAAPYIVLRMVNRLTNSIYEKLNDPTTWQNPFQAVTQYNFQATSPQEISFNANQVLLIAPQHLQGNLWNSGWVMASADRQHAGLVPLNFVKFIMPVSQSGGEQRNDMNNSVGTDQSITNMDKYYHNDVQEPSTTKST